MTGAVPYSLWHMFPLLQVERPTEWIFWWSLATISRRVLIVWLIVYGGKSVFGAALLHAMSNLSWMMFPVMGSHYDPVSTAVMTVTLMSTLVLLGPPKFGGMGRR